MWQIGFGGCRRGVEGKILEHKTCSILKEHWERREFECSGMIYTYAPVSLQWTSTLSAFRFTRICFYYLYLISQSFALVAAIVAGERRSRHAWRTKRGWRKFVRLTIFNLLPWVDYFGCEHFFDRWNSSFSRFLMQTTLLELSVWWKLFTKNSKIYLEWHSNSDKTVN